MRLLLWARRCRREFWRAAPSAKAGLLLDVVPLSLGIETVGGAMAKLIVRNTTARQSEMFSTSVDNQTGIKLHVLQGSGRWRLTVARWGGLRSRVFPPMPAGIPKLRVEFAVDASEILTGSRDGGAERKRLRADRAESWVDAGGSVADGAKLFLLMPGRT